MKFLRTLRAALLGWLFGKDDVLEEVESSVRPPPLPETPDLDIEPISLSPRAIIRQRLPPPRPPRKD